MSGARSHGPAQTGDIRVQVGEHGFTLLRTAYCLGQDRQDMNLLGIFTKIFLDIFLIENK